MADCCRVSGRRVVVAAVFGLVAALGACGPRPVHQVIADADKAAFHQQYDVAEADYREAVERKPGEWRARVGLGKMLLQRGEAKEARQHLDVAYTIRPDEPGILDLLAQAQVRSGDIEGMTRELRRVAEIHQGVNDWVRLGRFLQEAGDVDGARVALNTAAAIDGGKTVGPQLALARFYDHIGDDKAALDRYRMALWIDGKNEAAQEGIRAHGQVPGPTYMLQPAEFKGE